MCLLGIGYPHILGIRLGIEYRLIQGFLQEHRLDNTLEHLQECLLETIQGLS